MTTEAHRHPGPAILGVNYNGADPNASLVIDGEIIAAVEEERFIRDKHALGRFPAGAIRYCLDECVRRGRELTHVAFGWNCHKYTDGRMAGFFEDEINTRYKVDEGTLRWQRWMQETYDADRVRERILEYLKKEGLESDRLPEVRFLDHHQTHAFGAYAFSGFQDASIITLDGSGEETCTAIWSGHEDSVQARNEYRMPHSLGWYYAAMTEYLGFQAYDGEYKVMGLAPYGVENEEITARLRQLLSIDRDSGNYRLDPNLIHYGAHTYSGRFTDALVALMGRPPRARGSDPDDFYKSVARSTQNLLEEAGLALAERAARESGNRQLCLAGGTALNCKMSQRILESGLVDDIFVLPNAGDGGQSLSAALFLSSRLGYPFSGRLRSMAFGPCFPDREIRKVLDDCLLEYEHVSADPERAAQDIAAGKVVGWFQGSMEFGPRALGSRSILADPRYESSRDKVNGVVKYREYWRPFCPSMPAEEAGNFFSVLPSDAPFMTITLPVRPEKRASVPAIVHVDGSARPQLVHKDIDPVYYELIRRFGNLTGVPVLLNTSFNVKGEPIVCTPRDAIRNFYSCGMDVLYLGGFRLAKGRP